MLTIPALADQFKIDYSAITDASAGSWFTFAGVVGLVAILTSVLNTWWQARQWRKYLRLKEYLALQKRGIGVVCAVRNRAPLDHLQLSNAGLARFHADAERLVETAPACLRALLKEMASTASRMLAAAVPADAEVVSVYVSAAFQQNQLATELRSQLSAYSKAIYRKWRV